MKGHATVRPRIENMHWEEYQPAGDEQDDPDSDSEFQLA